jgi:hypothetical protein
MALHDSWATRAGAGTVDHEVADVRRALRPRRANVSTPGRCGKPSRQFGTGRRHTCRGGGGCGRQRSRSCDGQVGAGGARGARPVVRAQVGACLLDGAGPSGGGRIRGRAVAESGRSGDGAFPGAGGAWQTATRRSGLGAAARVDREVAPARALRRVAHSDLARCGRGAGRRARRNGPRLPLGASARFALHWLPDRPGARDLAQRATVLERIDRKISLRCLPAPR